MFYYVKIIMTLRDLWSDVNLPLWLFALIAVLFNFDSIKLASFEIKHILVMYTLRYSHSRRHEQT